MTSKSILFLLLAFLVGGIVVLLVSKLDIFSNNNDNKIDPNFEMIDPENPTTTVDNIFRVKKEFERTKLEKCVLQQLFIELKEKKITSESGASKNDTTLTVPPDISNEETFYSYLELYAVSSVYDFNWPLHISGCSGYNNNTITKQFIIQSLYETSQRSYINKLKSILLSSNVPQQLAYKYYAYYYGGAYGGYNGYYGGLSTNQGYLPPYDVQGNEGKQKTNVNPLFKNDKEIAKKSAVIIKELNALLNEKQSLLNRSLQKRNKTLDSTLIAQQKLYTDSVAKYAASRLDINDKAIKYGIFAFCFTALSMYLAGLYIRSIQLKRNENKPVTDVATSNEEARISMWYSVYMITVLLLIITIFILGLARLLTENTLAALLGGIAGYVLNNKMGDNLNPKSTGVTSVVTTGTTTPPATPVTTQVVTTPVNPNP